MEQTLWPGNFILGIGGGRRHGPMPGRKMTLLSTPRFLSTDTNRSQYIPHKLAFDLLRILICFLLRKKKCWLQTEGSLLKGAQRTLCRMPVVFTRLKARNNLMGICLVKNLAVT